MSLKKEQESVDNFLLRELAIRLWVQDVLFEDLTTKGSGGGSGIKKRPPPITPTSREKGNEKKKKHDEEDEEEDPGPFGDVTLPDLLKDGVRLCKLMLAIVPRSIPVIHKGRDSHRLAYKKRANVSFFLAACDEIGIPPSESFLVDDLYEHRNFLKVMECVERLGDFAYEGGFYFVLQTPEEVYEDQIKKKAGGKPMEISDGLRLLFSDEDRRRAKVLLERSRPKKRATLGTLSSEELAHLDEEEASIAERFYAGGAMAGGGMPLDPRAKSIALGRQTKPTLASFFLEKNSLPSATLRMKPPIPSKPVAGGKPSPMDAAEKRMMDEREALLKEEALFLKSVTKVQALARGWIIRRAYKERVRNAEYRRNVAKEIYQTEKDYLRSLEILQNVFMQPMCSWDEENIKLIEIKALQSDIKVIYGYNSQLLQDLKPRIKNWHPHQTLGDIFVKVSTFLRVYTQYVADYGKAMREIYENKKRCPRFKEFMMDPLKYSHEPEKYRAKLGGMLFGSYVIQPVQRIPRYLMLLKELGRRTETDHKDYENLKKAADSIGDVANYVEKKAQEAENTNKVLEIQSRLHGNPNESLVQPNRKFVREGLLFTEKFGKLGLNITAKRMVFLFNNLLLVTKPMKNQGDEEDTLLQYIKASEIANLSPISVPDVIGKETRRNCICLINEQRETEFTFYAASKLEKREWLKDLLAVKLSGEMRTKNHKEVLKKYSRLSTANLIQPIQINADRGAEKMNVHVNPLMAKQMPKPKPPPMGGSPSPMRGPAGRPNPQGHGPGGGGGAPGDKLVFGYSTKKLSKLFGVDEKIIEKAQQKPSLPSMLRRMYSNVDLKLNRRNEGGPLPRRGGGSGIGGHSPATPGVSRPIQVQHPIRRAPSKKDGLSAGPDSGPPDEDEMNNYLSPLLEMLLNCIDIQETSFEEQAAAAAGGRPPSTSYSGSPNSSGGSPMSRSLENLPSLPGNGNGNGDDPWQRDKKRRPPPPPDKHDEYEDTSPRSSGDLSKPSGRRVLSPKTKGPPPAPPTSSGAATEPPPLRPPRGSNPPPPKTTGNPAPSPSPASPSQPSRPPRPGGGSGIVRPPSAQTSAPSVSSLPPAASPIGGAGAKGNAPIRPARPSREDSALNVKHMGGPSQPSSAAPPVPHRGNKRN